MAIGWVDTDYDDADHWDVIELMLDDSDYLEDHDFLDSVLEGRDEGYPRPTRPQWERIVGILEEHGDI